MARSLGSGDLVDCLIELGRSAPLVVMDYDYGIGSFSSFKREREPEEDSRRLPCDFSNAD